MSLKRILAGALGVVALSGAAQTTAFATPSRSAPATSPQVANVRSAHASLQLDIGHAKAWVGQALPVTLRAYFRGAEGVTIEGAPQLTSPGIFTSELTQEPRQATEMIGGEPVLVATWTGTVTPSSPGSLPVVGELPVRVRYREAAPQVAMPAMPDLSRDDPFAAFGGSPFDTSFFRHFVEQSSGRVREESVTLRASAQAIEALALPVAGQPPTFTGAVGRFDLRASVSSASAHVSEPVTLTIAVGGEGDFDRVDVSGVATSSDWKAYPPSVKADGAPPGKRSHRKLFQQVLVPLHGGRLTIPPVSLVAFDPVSGRYLTEETSPLVLPVEGAAVAADVASVSASAPSAPAPAIDEPGMGDVGPLVTPAVVRPAKVALRIAPALLLVLAAAFFAGLRRKRTERVLRRSMRRAATQGDVVPFYRSAHALIETRLSSRWNLPSDTVSIDVIRQRLGADGDPLADVLMADEALRFGRARLENPDLVPLCSSIERVLGGVS
ncbi:MAG: hypothetical protein ACLQVI_18170 [Polyangiaceae bacterium]